MEQILNGCATNTPAGGRPADGAERTAQHGVIAYRRRCHCRFAGASVKPHHHSPDLTPKALDIRSLTPDFGALA